MLVCKIAAERGESGADLEGDVCLPNLGAALVPV